MGLPDAVHESILRCDSDKQPILYRNIMAMGGNVEFKNFRPRLLEGIRSLANDEYDVRVGDPKNPSQACFFKYFINCFFYRASVKSTKKVCMGMCRENVTNDEFQSQMCYQRAMVRRRPSGY